MHNRWTRHSACSAVRWVAALPFLFVGAMLFWTMALGLGALSLVSVGAFGAPNCDREITQIVREVGEAAPTAIEPMPGHIEPITIRIQESAEPEDVNDNAGAVAPAPATVHEDP